MQLSLFDTTPPFTETATPRFISLGSGSCGNCYFIEHGNDALLIDQGVAIRTFKKHVREYGVNLGRLRAILVTHDHTDHTKAVGLVSTELNLPVYTSEQVHEGMLRNRIITKKVPTALRHTITHDRTFDVGPFSITPFHITHDSADNNGFFISIGADAQNPITTFCILTDVGHIDPHMIPHIRQARNLIIEANYDELMLAGGPYPARLKKRITCGRGHLSNAITAETLRENLTPRTQNVWLCHLSEQNNSPLVAYQTVKAALDELPFAAPHLEVLPRRTPSGFKTLT